MPAKHYTKEERKEQVMLTFMTDVQHGKVKKLSMYAIAKRLDMCPSSHLMKIIKSLVKDGILQEFSANHRPGKTKSLFLLYEHAYFNPKKTNRTIKVNPNRSNQTELSL